jgi:regulator of protease activity HflC (stomatin/prohibitin superfamily)
MFGIQYLKAAPTTHVMEFRGGRLRREGAGLSFLYYAPTTTLALVPLASTDAPFAFAEATADFQSVTIQGQLGYRIADPRKAAALLDFSVDARGSYRSEDPAVLSERLVHAAQVLARAFTLRFPLREVLTRSDALAAEVLPALRKDEAVTLLGVEILGLSVLSLRPAPEMAKALEAEAREALQRRADEAIYARRNAAVEQERLIKESELNTEIAVEEKRRVVRETQMAAEVAVEEKRRALIDARVENERKDADARGYALEAVVRHVRDLDWRTLLALGGGGLDSRLLVADAFRELAANAGKIGELNVTPDLLKSLLKEGGR